MAHTPKNDDLASICSSLSSDDSVRIAGGGHANEHLVDLLTRPRSRGGYGGRLSYGEFSTLAQSLGWSIEDMDDCWYDIMMGVPAVEAVDMSRVAECVCSYCLTSPLPLLERYALSKAEAKVPPRSSSSSTTSSTGDEKVQAVTPPPPPTALPVSRNSNATVVPPPPSPRRPTASSAVTAADAHRKENKKSGDGTAKNMSATQPVAAHVRPRYTVETVSSGRKRLTGASPLSRSRRHPSPSQMQATSPSRRHSIAAPDLRDSAPPQHDSNTVFFRLYENGLEQQRKRGAAKPLAADDEIAECTFKPKLQPYTFKGSSAAEGRLHYNKPTKSFFAKLVDGAERSGDAIDMAPETPRVAYHPAPGPSSNVPVGYVKGVARLRRYLASRYQHTDFKSSLRDVVHRDVERLADAPILRLPVTVEGVADTVDVRLASASRSTPSRQQSQEPRYRISHARHSESSTAASTPRRTPSALVRYKEHLAQY
ncbi:hypothetical protein ABL78_3346 [Leptomonas seymouri]|uniref:Uncharacterized protein n=1 Tax=Leptomonas seymouri TaxID=5684 RepID=A0A0N0P6F0_LEPSE|nr:hypothetical protein ABL78_3346 [Leptomonas seymouri]|eukprot:KPI87549.1 hypothetical protein ABL78_3346 [Leptomonas seymouri]